MAKGRKTGGRLPGSRNKVTRDVQAISRALIDDEAYRAALRTRLLEGTAGSAMETLLWYYGFGRPVIDTAGDTSLPASITISF